jgi:hypothetical protein
MQMDPPSIQPMQQQQRSRQPYQTKMHCGHTIAFCEGQRMMKESKEPAGGRGWLAGTMRAYSRSLPSQTLAGAHCQP